MKTPEEKKKKKKKAGEENDKKKCEHCIKCTKMKDYFCMWLQYYILFFWDSSGQKNNIFYERFLIYTCPLPLYLNSHYLCAKWNGKLEVVSIGAVLICSLFFFLPLFFYDLYREQERKREGGKKNNIVPFHQCQLFCCLRGLWEGTAKTQKLFKFVRLSSGWGSLQDCVKDIRVGARHRMLLKWLRRLPCTEFQFDGILQALYGRMWSQMWVFMTRLWQLELVLKSVVYVGEWLCSQVKHSRQVLRMCWSKHGQLVNTGRTKAHMARWYHVTYRVFL